MTKTLTPLARLAVCVTVALALFVPSLVLADELPADPPETGAPLEETVEAGDALPQEDPSAEADSTDAILAPTQDGQPAESLADDQAVLVPEEAEDSSDEELFAEPTASSAASQLIGKVFAINSGKGTAWTLSIKDASTANKGASVLAKAGTALSLRWKVVDAGDGYVTLVNVNSGRVLDVAGGKRTNGTVVWQYGSNGSAAQKWLPVEVSTDTYVLVSALSASQDQKDWLVLDLSGGKLAANQKIQVWRYNGSAAQQWVFGQDTTARTRSAADIEAFANENAGTLKDGQQVVLAPQTGAYQVLDVKGGSTANKANVQGYTSNSTDAQTWVVKVDAAGFVTLANKKSGKVLDVSGGKASNKTNIQQYSSNGTKAQKWVAAKNEDGTITLWSALGKGMVIDVSGGKSANGTNIQLYLSNDSKAQHLAVVEPGTTKAAARTVDDGYYTIGLTGANAVIDIKGGSTASGAVAQVYTSNASLAQVYHVRYASDGYYRIEPLVSHMALSVGTNLLPGAPVKQEAIKDTATGQKWNIVASGSSYQIVSALTGQPLGATSANKATALQTTSSLAKKTWTLTEAKPAVETGVYTIVSALNRSYVFDITSGSTANGAQLQLYTSNGSYAQRFYLEKQESGAYTIECLKSTKQLSAKTAGKVCQQLPATDDNQLWKIAYTPYGYKFVNVATGKAISFASAKNSTKAAQDPSGTSNKQSFSLKAASAFEYGTYVISSNVDNAHCLDVSGGNTKSGANVQLYTQNKTAAQKWHIESAGSPYVTITNANSSLMLDVAGGKATSGANVDQFTSGTAAREKWKITYVGDGCFTIASALDTSKVLDAAGGKAADKTNVQVYQANGTKAQRWHLTKLNEIVIALDPGHGGDDSGAVGNGLREADLTWRITQSCATQLRSYGYTVYITKGQNESVSIKDRVERAYQKKATCIISIHIDAGGGHGAQVLVPNAASYNHSLYTQGQKFARILLPKINSIGISTNGDGTLERNYSVPDGADYNLYYSGGGLQDYYGIVRYARLHNMFGVIIEHGFIDSSDANLLRQTAVQNALGRADAEALHELYG